MSREADWALILIGRPPVPCVVNILRNGTSLQR
jgi:hypothetical protein